MKYLVFIFFLITSCSVSKLEYNPANVYLIVQSPNYNLYLSKTDMIESLDEVCKKRKIDFECIKKLNRTDSIKYDSSFLLEPSEYSKGNYPYKICEADAIQYCAIDLFQKHKILVYDKKQKIWISKYKTKHRSFMVVDEHYAFYDVLYNDSIIYSEIDMHLND